MRKIGIVGAMEVEVSYLKSIMTNAKSTQVANLSFFEGNLSGVDVVLVQSGIGKVNAAMCATILCSVFKVTHIINTGVAGGLQKDLHIFDVVVSKDAMYHDFDTTEFGYAPCTIPGLKTSIFEADDTLIELAKKAYQAGKFDKKIVEGRIATGDIFVNSSKIKDKIISVCKAWCVEMEGAAIAHVSHIFNVPFVIIRCISDMAENTEEVYHEETAAEVSSFLVENMLKMMN